VPFTLSHAAAVIPFRRTPLVPSALVIGCFAPDFSYLLSLTNHPPFSHTLPGMFLLDVPLALVALWLFHTFMKRRMLMLVPKGFRQRIRTSVTGISFRPPKHLALIVFSILIGTATHLVWDAFTHNTSWIYQNWSFLRGSVELPDASEMQMYKLLEYGSSAFGFVVVVVWIWNWYRTTEPSPHAVDQTLNAARKGSFVAILPAVALFGGILRAYHADGIQPAIRSLMHFTADTLISAITFLLMGLLACGIIERLLHRRHVFDLRP
jgi:hypothetical protein